MTQKTAKALRITGWVIHGLIGLLLVFAGGMKVLGMIPAEAVAEMSKTGIGDNVKLIGAGELVCVLLLLTPRTMRFGTWFTSGLWGGVICSHMINRESIIPGAVLLALTWLGAYFRDPGILTPGRPEPTPQSAPAAA